LEPFTEAHGRNLGLNAPDRSATLKSTDLMTSEYIEERNGAYYIAGTRISLDSVVYSFERGNSPEAIRQSFPALKLAQIYGAIAFYLDHQAEIRKYLENEERRVQESTIPLSEANPELWNRLQRAREELPKPQ
jgi:uncharacterized protein (DUF433 family)